MVAFILWGDAKYWLQTRPIGIIFRDDAVNPEGAGQCNVVVGMYISLMLGDIRDVVDRCLDDPMTGFYSQTYLFNK